MNRDEIVKLEKYLKNLFKLDSIEVRQRAKSRDAADVHIGEEFIGTVSRDEDGDYQFQMAILELDLE